MGKINSRIPEGPVAEKWTNYKAHQRLVNPKNKLKLDVIVVGTGLAGASAAASLGERSGSRGASQTCSHHDDVELQFILWIYQALMGLIFFPFVSYWSCRYS